jgi:hypothetical protein
MSGPLPNRWWLFSLWLALAPAALAQTYVRPYVSGYNAYPYYGGYGGYGYGNYGYGNNGIGSTAAGSYLGGMASTIRAQGQYNLLTSKAAVNLEDAATKEIDNQVRWTNAYFETRRMRDAYKQETKAPPTPPETWARLAHAAAPQRLASSDLDPITGAISWPALLEGDDFRSDRDTLEALFSDRAMTHGAIGVDAHARIRAAVDEALDRLKQFVGKVETRSYNQSRNFLTSLGYEASFPAG